MSRKRRRGMKAEKERGEGGGREERLRGSTKTAVEKFRQDCAPPSTESIAVESLRYVGRMEIPCSEINK